jgi:hypothetical protein
MEDGADVEGARASRMDEWIVWEAEKGCAQLITLFLLFSYSFILVWRTHTPRPAQNATLRAEDFFVVVDGRGR